jgi:putative selenate reductase
MGALQPQPLEVLLARALAEFEAERAIFGLPRRSFWRGVDGCDLSSAHSGGLTATPLGPAAGPHTQLAHNITVAWLAGARVVELKTVQVLDRLTIARPCIDAADVGYNVEWSQELPLEVSAEQYATAWYLIHALHARGVIGMQGPLATRFDASVGYDLAGIRSDKVARFLDTMRDAGELLRGLRNRLPPALRAGGPTDVPSRIVEVVTLSTFHGCPAEEVEAIVEHLLGRHAMHVVVKLNPTLLGYDATESLLRGRLGFDDIELDRRAFEQDLRWDQAVALFERLSPIAARSGLTLGAKFSNTLVVKNTRRVLAGEVVYLSGPPLHPIAIQLANRFARATGGRLPISFSGGVDAENFADTVACGLAPVTTCTDLLKPTGYRRLPRYLKFLVAEMERLDARDLAEFVVAKAGWRNGRPAAPDQATARAAGLHNLEDYAGRVAADPRYHAESHRAVPARKGRLALFDCASCNNCSLVCPNGAFFSVPIPPVRIVTWDLVIEGGSVSRRSAEFAVTREEQWVLYGDFCNDCGNCDPFCPEEGGPFRIKPRVFGNRPSFDASAPGDGIVCEQNGTVWLARFGGVSYEVEFVAGGGRISDGLVEATLDVGHQLVATRVLLAREGHVLPLWRYHALRVLREAVLRGINPVTAGRLAALRP